MILGEGQKVTHEGKKIEKKLRNFFSNQDAKRNKKISGRSHVITFGVFPF